MDISKIEAVREFARKFKSVIELADAVEPIANLELAKAELEGQVGKLQVLRDALTAETAEAKATAEKLVDEARAFAASELQRVSDEATSEAHVIEAHARKEAAKITDDAKAEADRLAKRIAKLKDTEADLDRDIAARKAELAALEEKVEAVHAKARTLLGG
jgi:chaperonin cofactor prefoldin